MSSPTVTFEDYQRAKAIVQTYEANAGWGPSGDAQLAALQAQLSQPSLEQRLAKLERRCDANGIYE